MSEIRQTPGDQQLPISAEEFDSKFEAGEDVGQYLDFSKANLVPPCADLDPQNGQH